MARRTILDDVGKVEKTLDIKSEIVRIINVPDEKLIDYPYNNEDIDYTEDLETSMKENGFTDPLEITDFKMDEGFYMIVSGHRRRMAGRKSGYGYFPCIVKHFQSEQEMKNYILMSNSYRNTENDPLLYAKRYVMHEAYLNEFNFKGDKATEIAKRLGMSRANALRYHQMSKVIVPMWVMVRQEQVGWTNVLFMHKYSEEEQLEIYNMFQQSLANGITLNRDYCNQIKEQYERKKAGFDGEQIPGQESIETLEDGAYMPEDYSAEEETIILPAEPVEAPIKDNVKKPEKTKSDVKVSAPANTKEEVFFHYLSKVDEYLTGDYVISSKDTAIRMISNLKNIIMESMEEMNNVGRKYNLDKMVADDLNEIKHTLNSLIKN